MGIKRFWRFLRDRKVYDPGKTSIPFHEYMESQQTTIYVDLMATFYSQIKRAAISGRLQQFVEFLRHQFEPFRDRVVLVLDGDRTKQKHWTHSKRDQKALDALAEATKLLSKAQAKGRRPKKFYYKNATRLFSKAFVLEPSIKRTLTSLILLTGLELVVAPGEADVYIGGIPGAVALTRDSDFLAYPNISMLLNPHFKFGTLWVIPISRYQVVQHLGLSSAFLSALAIVSGNDYCPNIYGMGVAKNLSLLREIQHYQP